MKSKLKNSKMRKILITCIAFYLSMSNLYCQNKTIKGRIVDEQLEFLPMVSIFNNLNVEVGKADMNGFFEIVIPVSENKLLFRFTGMEPSNIELTDNCEEVEIIMISSGTYDFITLRKADRLRKKKFKKLQKLHKMAFEQGVFRTDKACYIQEFIPYCKKKQ